MSSAQLSLEIAQLVRRTLAGETIDLSQAGAELAGRFPDLGMQGDLIAKAIERAAAMTGLVRDGRGAAKPAQPEAGPALGPAG